MKTQQRKLKQGFTIIEVMIVLAIAGLILLIVFLAVPALQRSARNTSRKNDVAAIGSAISNFVSNNNGSQPTANGSGSTDAGLLYLYCNTASTANFGAGSFVAGHNIALPAANCAATDVNYETAKLGYYTPAQAKIFFANAGAGFATAAVNAPETATAISNQSVTIDLGFSCNSTNSGVNATANPKSIALLYVTETSTGNGNLQCLQD